jgi:DMSO/TMAO reductase YedYZ molybdopterin-dependent catalytic subunit
MLFRIGSLRRLPMRRRVLHQHRHGIGAPSETVVTLEFLAAPLTASFGVPLRLRNPTNLGFKSPKSIVAMEVTNKWTGGYWANQSYNRFNGS